MPVMSEWSDWYRREDPTSWVLPRVLRERAERPADYLQVLRQVFVRKERKQ